MTCGVLPHLDPVSVLLRPVSLQPASPRQEPTGHALPYKRLLERHQRGSVIGDDRGIRNEADRYLGRVDVYLHDSCSVRDDPVAARAEAVVQRRADQDQQVRLGHRAERRIKRGVCIPEAPLAVIRDHPARLTMGENRQPKEPQAACKRPQRTMRPGVAAHHHHRAFC